MQEKLLGYLLDALDAGERREVEELLRSSATARADLERLRTALDPLAIDREEPVAPAGLVERTLGHVARYAVAAGHRLGSRPTDSFTPCYRPRLAPPRSDASAEGGSWRFRDLFVAASMAFVCIGLALAGVRYLHQQRELQACQNNLRQYHQAFALYADQNEGWLPVMTAAPPYDPCTNVVPQLVQAGVLRPEQRLLCPGDLAQLRLPPATSTLHVVSYAYPVGYRDEHGQVQGLRRSMPPADSDYIPLLADRRIEPPTPPHHSRGQNVLFLGGHARFCTTAQVGVNGDHIYANEAGQIGPGLHPYDSVLANGCRGY